MKKILKYLRPYLFYTVISPFLMMGEVMADLSLPFLMTYIVDYGISGKELTASGFALKIITSLYGENYTRMHIIVTFGVIMLFLVLVGGLFGTLCAYTSAKAAQGMGRDLRIEAYRRVMSLSIEQTDRFTTGSLVNRLTNDITMIINFVEMSLRMLVRSPIFFVGGTIMLLMLNINFGVVLLCSLPVLIIVMTLVLSKAIPLYSAVQKKLDRVNTVVQEDITGARMVKAYVMEDYEKERFRRANAELRDINYKVAILLASIFPVLTLILNVSVVAIIFIGGYQISIENAGMTAGSIMAGITYVTQVIFSIMMLSMVFQQISRSAASIKRINEVLESDPVIKSGNRDLSADSEAAAISFKNVSFRYPNTVGRPILQNVNLEIAKGEILAIIGKTGSGKTSLVNLIPRFYDATEGEVRVNGLPVKEADISRLREKIGFVMQKSELFSDTIANNIRWGREDASEDEIKEAAKTAQASEIAENSESGYETFIAEKGASLSGGQKQRISIARALARKPEILILDDATSALDLATEAKLQSALREKLGGTTVIIIAQRIASVKSANRIAVVENGTISACAPHEELLKISEAYREIYRSQMKGESADE